MAVKAALVRNEGGALEGTVACVHCWEETCYERTSPLHVPSPVTCLHCGRETEMTRRPGGVAEVRKPYGCRDWGAVQSSNLAAVGARTYRGAGTWLLVRFRAGAVYRYRLPADWSAADALLDLDRSPSVGRWFHAHVKPLGGERLCATYGCAAPAPSGSGLQCSAHGTLHASRATSG